MNRARDMALDVACALVRDEEGRFLACRRRLGVRDAGAWEFPGGKLEVGESPAVCVRRELREELGVEAASEAPIASVEAWVSGRLIRLHACPTVLDSVPYASTDHDRLEYLSLKELRTLRVTAAEAALVGALKIVLAGQSK